MESNKCNIMRLTEEQFKALAPYKSNFETMVRSKWARHPGSAALDLIHEIYCQVTGSTQKLNKGCSHCIMRLLEDMGRIFLADLEERNRREVEEKPEREIEVKKVKVTTRKPSKPKTQE